MKKKGKIYSQTKIAKMLHHPTYTNHYIYNTKISLLMLTYITIIKSHVTTNKPFFPQKIKGTFNQLTSHSFNKRSKGPLVHHFFFSPEQYNEFFNIFHFIALSFLDHSFPCSFANIRDKLA